MNQDEDDMAEVREWARAARESAKTSDDADFARLTGRIRRMTENMRERQSRFPMAGWNADKEEKQLSKLVERYGKAGSQAKRSVVLKALFSQAFGFQIRGFE
jgi:hypothetical protein